MNTQERPVDATLATFHGVADCTVRMLDGSEVAAVLDTAALRNSHGPIYGIKLGGRVQVIRDAGGGPAKIVFIEQAE